jgi:hypothetical protein
MQKRLALLCVVLMFLSALAVVFHHHEDGESHADCPACLAIHNSSSASVSHDFPEIQRSDDVIFFRPEVSFTLPNIVSIPGNTRAPPA